MPRATLTARNPRAEGFGPAALFPLQGATIPFASTQAERIAAGDPRPSLEERYGDEEGYRRALREAAARMVAERLLLPMDLPR